MLPTPAADVAPASRGIAAWHHRRHRQRTKQNSLGAAVGEGVPVGAVPAYSLPLYLTKFLDRRLRQGIAAVAFRTLCSKRTAAIFHVIAVQMLPELPAARRIKSQSFPSRPVAQSG